MFLGGKEKSVLNHFLFKKEKNVKEEYLLEIDILNNGN